MTVREVIAAQLARDAGYQRQDGSVPMHAFLGQADDILVDLKRAGYTVAKVAP